MKLAEAHTSSLAIMIADRISAMIAYWDKDCICRFANAAYLDWFGKRKEEMIDKITIKELLGPLYEKNLPYILDALKGNVQTFEREIRLPDGEIRYSLAHYYPDIVNGKVKGFIAHVADVTPLKLLETEFKKSYDIIKEQNERLLNFSNIVSHNLKSYSNNLASILELYAAADLEHEKNRMFNYLKNISEGFTLTVRHLNEIVKFQNQAKIDFTQINLHEYIEKIKETLHIQIISNKAIVKNNVSTDVALLVNPAYMESILLNFLTNAIKYKHPDRVPIIEINSYKEDNKTALLIKDNGIGINLEKHGADLFGMYKTFHNNHDAQGVGLFITKYQIETMGGQVKVESQENVGTTFTIYFNSSL